MVNRRARGQRLLALLTGTVCAAALAVGVPAHADSGRNTDSEATELMDRFDQFDAARTAPTGLVAPGAYSAAYGQLTALPAAAGSWSDVTKTPYNADDPNYRDPGASNSSGGAGYVTGRIQALAVDASCIFAGAASG